MLNLISLLATIATAIAAGLEYFSFWWVLIPAFVLGAFALSNGPQYGAIISANEEGRMGVLPLALAGTVGMSVLLAAVFYWVTRLVTRVGMRSWRVDLTIHRSQRISGPVDDERYPAAITDPALILVALGALFGLLAAFYWYKVFRATGPDGARSRGDLSSAAFATAVALFLACGGFLFGLFTGRF